MFSPVRAAKTARAIIVGVESESRARGLEERYMACYMVHGCYRWMEGLGLSRWEAAERGLRKREMSRGRGRDLPQGPHGLVEGPLPPPRPVVIVQTALAHQHQDFAQGLGKGRGIA
eukprot:scaffold11097_cov116-Isochrysis_galbana.AAC.7